MDLPFYKKEFEKAGEQIEGYTISKINKTIIKLNCSICVYIHIMGLSESSLTTITTQISCLSIVKYRVIVHIVNRYVAKIIIACLI